MNHFLIGKYLAGECSIEEERTLHEWLKVSEDNKRHFIEVRETWERTKWPSVTADINVDDSYAQVKERIAGKTIEKHPTTGFFRIWKIAAVTLLFIGLSILLKTITNREQLIVSNNGDIMHYALQDGSLIILNKNAAVKLPPRFGRGERTLSLTGEAFFKVVHDESKPFIVHTPNARVRVLGTSFNVKSNENSTEVVVETGQVELSNQETRGDAAKHVIIPEGHLGKYDRTAVNMAISINNDRNYFAWRTRDLVFKQRSLRDVADKLEELYHVKVFFRNDSLAELKLTARYTNKDLPGVLDIITKTFSIHYELKGNKVYLFR